MAEGVLMPKEGITVESCSIGEWKKNVGDAVNVGDILFTYETDKAEFECESTAAGTLLAKFYEDGDEVPCLANVCAIGKEGDAFEFLKPGAEVPAPAAAPAQVYNTAPCAEGDVITKIGDTAISDMNDLNAAKKSYRAGDTVTLTIYRAGGTKEVELTFDAVPQTQETAQDNSQQQQQGGSNGGYYYNPWDFFNSFFGNGYYGSSYSGESRDAA